MRKLMMGCMLGLLLVSCTPVSTPPTPTSTRTATPYPPTATLPPTSTSTPAPVPVDVFHPSSEWPQDAQLQFHDVLTDPWHATAERKNQFDAAIIAQWRQTLKDAGVPGAESLQGYNLLSAIVEYAQTNHVHEAWLPFSMIRMVMVDGNNVITYGEAPASSGPFSNARVSWFGFGSESGHDLTALQNQLSWTTSVNFYGENIVRGGAVDPVILREAFEGNVGLRFFLPGVNADSAQGLLITMIDTTGTTRYALGRVSYDATSTSRDTDICEVVRGSVGTFETCGTNVATPTQTSMTFGTQRTVHRPATRTEMDFLMDQGEMHIDIHVAFPSNPTVVWMDGMVVINFFRIWSEGHFSP